MATAYIPASKIHILADAVNNQCDALDGIKDGVLNDPRRCNFNPETLLCKGSDTSECYTGEQVAAVRKIWAGLRTPEGQVIYPGLVPGGEAGPGGWAGYVTGDAPGKGRHAGLGVPFFKFMVFDDPNWDYKTFKFTATDGFDSDIDYTDSKLARFVQRGESRSQPVQSPRRQADSLSRLERPGHYAAQQHQLLRERREGAGRRRARIAKHGGVLPALHGAGDATLPGRTGSNGFRHDRATGPVGGPRRRAGQVIASHATNGVVDRTRPLCPYPQEAQWNGAGSTDDAANFTCALPKQ